MDRWQPGTRLRSPGGHPAIYLGDGWAWMLGGKYDEADSPDRPPRRAARTSDRWRVDRDAGAEAAVAEVTRRVTEAELAYQLDAETAAIVRLWLDRVRRALTTNEER